MSSPLPSRDNYPTWSPTDIFREEEDTQKHTSIVGTWYRFTSIPENPLQTSFIKREAERKSRLLSTAVFFLMFILLLILPATFFIPNKNVLWLCLGMIGICVLSLILNHNGKTLIAGISIVVLAELVIMIAIVSTIPFDIANLPLYDMLVLSELLAASLLPGGTIFLVAVLNCLFIWLDLIFQPSTSALAHYLASPLFYTALIRPIVVQILVAIVVYIWVRSTRLAIERADKAEMLAQLQHALAEQKKQLEIGIQEILQTHTAVSNGNLEVRVPLTQEHALWPLANALNTLLTRFQRSARAEQYLQQIQVTLPPIVNQLQEAELHQRPVPIFQPTGTPLDPLLSWLSGRIISRRSSATHLSKGNEKSLRDQTLHGI